MRLFQRTLCNRLNILPAGTKWEDYNRRHIRNYLAMVTEVDEQFGRILHTLAEGRLEVSPIVVFTSDHGNFLEIHNQISKNNPYEESMDILLLIHWPSKLHPQWESLLFSFPDIYPTLLELRAGQKMFLKMLNEPVMLVFCWEEKALILPPQLYLKIPYGLPAWGSRGVRTHR